MIDKLLHRLWGEAKPNRAEGHIPFRNISVICSLPVRPPIIYLSLAANLPLHFCRQYRVTYGLGWHRFLMFQLGRCYKSSPLEELLNLIQPNLLTNLNVTLYLDLLPPPLTFSPHFCRAYGLKTDFFIYLFPYVIYPLHQGRKSGGGAALICESYSCAANTANFNLVC